MDTDSHQVIATIDLPTGAPVGVAGSPDGQRIYVVNGNANSDSVVDAVTHVTIAEVPVVRRRWGITVAADGSRIYTANGLTNDVSVVDGESCA